MRRGVPVPTAPVFRIDVICPKPSDDRLPDGLSKMGWLNRLKASARKFIENRSLSRNLFCSAVSIS